MGRFSSRSAESLNGTAPVIAELQTLVETYMSDDELKRIVELIRRFERQDLSGQTKKKNARHWKEVMIECNLCKATDKLHRHRIIPGYAGGKYEDSNVCIVCGDCHRLIHRIIDNLGHEMINYKLAIELARLEVK